MPQYQNGPMTPYQNLMAQYQNGPMAPYRIKQQLLEEHGDDYILGYRADPTNKYGGKDGLETQPTLFHKDDMAAVLRAMTYLRDKYGVEHIDPKALATFALKEGRTDFGINTGGYAPLMPSTLKLANKVYADPNMTLEEDKDGMNWGISVDKQGQHYNFPAALRASELMLKARRLKKPLEALWNPGEKRYTEDYAIHAPAVEAGKNDPLTDFIYNNLGLSKPDPQKLSAIPTPEVPDMPISLPDSYRMGGRVRMI